MSDHGRESCVIVSSHILQIFWEKNFSWWPWLQNPAKHYHCSKITASLKNNVLTSINQKSVHHFPLRKKNQFSSRWCQKRRCHFFLAITFPSLSSFITSTLVETGRCLSTSSANYNFHSPYDGIVVVAALVHTLLVSSCKYYSQWYWLVCCSIPLDSLASSLAEAAVNFLEQPFSVRSTFKSWCWVEATPCCCRHCLTPS